MSNHPRFSELSAVLSRKSTPHELLEYFNKDTGFSDLSVYIPNFFLLFISWLFFVLILIIFLFGYV